MTIETATDVTQLNPSYPESGTAVGKGDNHLRLIKQCLYNTFYGATTTGVTGYNVVTQTAGNNTTLAASTAFVKTAVDAAAFSATLPAGTEGQILYTISGVPGWDDFPLYVENAAYRSFNTAFGAFNGNNP